MKILYVTTISNTVNAFLIPHIKMLIEEGHQVDVAFNIVQEVSNEILDLKCRVYNLEFERSPLNKNNLIAYKKLKKIVASEQYDIVHTHTPVASACVRIACKNMKDVKVIYTAHGFHFYKGAPIKNWLIYYPIEKWLSTHTDVLLTINKEDYNRAKTSFKAKRIEYIPGVGLDTKKFNKIEFDRVTILKELEVPTNAFIILSVGELNKNKNHETIIKAIEKINNPNIYYLICGQGSLEEYLKKLSNKLGIRNQVKLLGHRSDIPEICSVADIFAFPSKREGLGMAALEAMATGLPLITSNIHGIKDYSIDGESGFPLNSWDVEGFSKKIEILKNNEQLRYKLGRNNANSVQNYNIENTLMKLTDIYKKL